jgi:hypothetical protein
MSLGYIVLGHVSVAIKLELFLFSCFFVIVELSRLDVLEN